MRALGDSSFTGSTVEPLVEKVCTRHNFSAWGIVFFQGCAFLSGFQHHHEPTRTSVQGSLCEYMVQECLKTRLTKQLWLTTAIPSHPAAKVHSIRIVDDGKLSKVAGRLVKFIAISNGTAMQASEMAPTAAAVVAHRASPRCWQ